MYTDIIYMYIIYIYIHMSLVVVNCWDTSPEREFKKCQLCRKTKKQIKTYIGHNCCSFWTYTDTHLFMCIYIYLSQNGRRAFETWNLRVAFLAVHPNHQGLLSWFFAGPTVKARHESQVHYSCPLDLHYIPRISPMISPLQLPRLTSNKM